MGKFDSYKIDLRGMREVNASYDWNIDNEFFDFVLSVASGAQTKNEQQGYREISIFKDGVTL